MALHLPARANGAADSGSQPPRTGDGTARRGGDVPARSQPRAQRSSHVPLRMLGCQLRDGNTRRVILFLLPLSSPFSIAEEDTITLPITRASPLTRTLPLNLTSKILRILTYLLQITPLEHSLTTYPPLPHLSPQNVPLPSNLGPERCLCPRGVFTGR